MVTQTDMANSLMVCGLDGEARAAVDLDGLVVTASTGNGGGVLEHGADAPLGEVADFQEGDALGTELPHAGHFVGGDGGTATATTGGEGITNRRADGGEDGGHGGVHG